MSNQNNPEYVLAMRELQEFCTLHRIKPNNKLCELFWHGVIHGKNRTTALMAIRRAQTELPKPKPLSQDVVLRDSGIDISLRRSDPSQNTGESDLGKAGSFRL